jgi:hypothetical protein
MPTTEVIQEQLDTPLTPLERERVREILGYSRAQGETLSAMIDELTAPQNQFMRAIILRWDEVGDDTERITGGRDALDADPERNREMVRRRVRQLLGLPEISGVSTLDNSQLIQGYSLRLGWTRR